MAEKNSAVEAATAKAAAQYRMLEALATVSAMGHGSASSLQKRYFANPAAPTDAEIDKLLYEAYQGSTKLAANYADGTTPKNQQTGYAQQLAGMLGAAGSMVGGRNWGSYEATPQRVENDIKAAATAAPGTKTASERASQTSISTPNPKLPPVQPVDTRPPLLPAKEPEPLNTVLAPADQATNVAAMEDAIKRAGFYGFGGSTSIIKEQYFKDAKNPTAKEVEALVAAAEKYRAAGLAGRNPYAADGAKANWAKGYTSNVAPPVAPNTDKSSPGQPSSGDPATTPGTVDNLWQQYNQGQSAPTNYVTNPLADPGTVNFLSARDDFREWDTYKATPERVAREANAALQQSRLLVGEYDVGGLATIGRNKDGTYYETTRPGGGAIGTQQVGVDALSRLVSNGTDPLTAAMLQQQRSGVANDVRFQQEQARAALGNAGRAGGLSNVMANQIALQGRQQLNEIGLASRVQQRQQDLATIVELMRAQQGRAAIISGQTPTANDTPSLFEGILSGLGVAASGASAIIGATKIK